KPVKCSYVNRLRFSTPNNERLTMSQLYWTEGGHVVPTLGEEVTTYRRVRKVLQLPGTAHPATLFVLARAYAGNDSPLRLSVNGATVAPIPPGDHLAYRWHSVTLPPEVLKPGANTIELWSDSAAMDAWSLGIEGGHREPASYI